MEHSFQGKVVKALAFQLTKYPALSLIDIYKSFFQDAFGPGHLIEDEATFRTCVSNELKNMKSRGNRSAEVCGCGFQYCRIPLDVVVDGLLDEEEFMSACIASASSFTVPQVEEWKNKWEEIFTILLPLHTDIRNFNKDSLTILTSLEKGICMMSHSDLYKRLYNPHYRICTMEQQKRLYDLCGIVS